MSVKARGTTRRCQTTPSLCKIPSPGGFVFSEASAPSEKPVHAGGNTQWVASTQDFTPAGSAVPTEHTARGAGLARTGGTTALAAQGPGICRPLVQGAHVGVASTAQANTPRPLGWEVHKLPGYKAARPGMGSLPGCAEGSAGGLGGSACGELWS